MSPPPTRFADPVTQFLLREFDRSFARSSVQGVHAWPRLKRGLDALLSALLLLAMLPVLATIAIAIKLDSPGPVFYRVRRVGYRGRPLHMLKFRKMFSDAEGGPLTTATDPRLTRVGRFLTRTRLDELPQLWDVLRGRMSLIGPRPEDPFFAALHPEPYETIHSVRPGMTGITQLAFADESNILDAQDPIGDYITRILPHKVQLDLLYAQNCGIRLDVAVLVWTIVAVTVHRPVAVNRATGRINARRRPAPAQSVAAARRSSGALRPAAPRTVLRDATLRTAGAGDTGPTNSPPPAAAPTTADLVADDPPPREVAFLRSA